MQESILIIEGKGNETYFSLFDMDPLLTQRRQKDVMNLMIKAKIISVIAQLSSFAGDIRLFI
jgi:hypothetical protein